MTLQTVKLSNLRLSPLNVRKVKPKHIEALASDIMSHGVLQNLIVYKNGRGYMGAAQAYTLTDDVDRQLEVFSDAGDNVHRIRSLLTE